MWNSNVFRLQGFCALFALCGLLSGAVFFYDDFNDYTDDAELQGEGWEIVDVNNPVENAAWTVTNPVGRANPPTRDGTPSEGNFMISDSDWATGENPTGTGISHDLWSPSFSCEGAESVWLHFDCSAQLNNNGKCVFDVDVSTDGGSTWVNVFRRVAPSRVEAPPYPDSDTVDGVFGPVDVDITAQAAGKPEVRIRWRHFEPNDDWWIAIDNMVVDDIPPVGGGRYTLTALESFDAGIPPEWTIRSLMDPPNEGAKTWTASDPCSRDVAQAGGDFTIYDGRGVGRLEAPFAIMDSDCDPDPAEDEYLVTPVIDCSKAERVFLHWKSETVVGSGIQEVLVSLDGGETFDPDPVFSYSLGALFDPGEDPFYAERIIEVPQAAGEPQVAFAFHFQSGGNQGWWAVDDVKVTAEGDIEIVNCANQNFRVRFDPESGTVVGTWQALPGIEGYRVFQEDRQVGEDLGPDARSFTDPNPPPGATDVVYRLQSLAGGSVVLECTSTVARTFKCPEGLTCARSGQAGSVVLTWTKGVNLNADGYRIERGGQVVGTVPVDSESFMDNAPPGVHDYTLSVVSAAGADPQQCTSTLTCRVWVLGSYLFFDDFEAYADDAELQAAGWVMRDENNPVEASTWTITNPGRRANPPTFDGFPSGGKFLISDSDAQGPGRENPTGSGMSHDLWSPIIDCSQAKQVWLHFDCSAQLNNNGKAVFDVDVSKDGGGSWENVFRRVAPQRTEAPPFVDTDNADGFFGRLHIDITPWAAGENNVRIRWRHFEPNWDWWIAIDNVLVDENPVEGGDTVLLPLESFDTGIPDDWIVDSWEGGGLITWSTEDTCQRSIWLTGGVFPDPFDGRGLHRLDEHFAIIDGSCAQVDQNEILATPVIDCSRARRVFLHVKSEIVPSATAVQEILLSVDGGATFDLEKPVFSYNGGGLFDEGEDPFYGEYIFEVPKAAGQSEVVFAFHYQAVPGGGDTLWWWAVDDVMVTAEVEEAGEMFVRGDVNDDGTLNIADPISLLGYLFGGQPAPGCPDAADGNDDGALNIADAIAILGHLFGGTGPLPAPFPECGSDTVQDSLPACTYKHCP